MWPVYKPDWGQNRREDNTDRCDKWMQETRPGLDVVRMEGYEKVPVPEFECVAKCDRCNDQVGDARKGRVTAVWRKGKVWAGMRKKLSRSVRVESRSG